MNRSVDLVSTVTDPDANESFGTRRRYQSDSDAIHALSTAFLVYARSGWTATHKTSRRAEFDFIDDGHISATAVLRIEPSA